VIGIPRFGRERFFEALAGGLGTAQPGKNPGPQIQQLSGAMSTGEQVFRSLQRLVVMAAPVADKREVESDVVRGRVPAPQFEEDLPGLFVRAERGKQSAELEPVRVRE